MLIPVELYVDQKKLLYCEAKYKRYPLRSL